MAEDFIQGQGQQQGQPPQQGQQPQQRPSGAPMEFVGEGIFKEEPTGEPQGAGIGVVDENPFEADEEQATPEEQAAYEQLFLKAMNIVHSTKPIEGKDQPPTAEAIVRQLTNPNIKPEAAIGGTAATILSQLIDREKRNNVEYPPDIIKEVGIDLVYELYEIADVSGAIKNLPAEDTPEYDKLIELCALEATKAYGQHLMDTGQTDQRAHMAELQDEMQREAESGELDDWGMEEFDPQTRQQIEQQLGAAKNGS